MQPLRADHSAAANGLQWDVGAISNAEWTGVKLRDVLQDAGLPVSDLPEYAKHAQLFGAEGYGASIPIYKACDPRGDVLLAFRMNGAPLPADHGAPVRALGKHSVLIELAEIDWLFKCLDTSLLEA